MNRPWDYIDVLTELAQEDTLRAWLARQGLRPAGTSHHQPDSWPPASGLLDAVEALPQDMRARLIRRLSRAAQLGDEFGRRAMQDAAADRQDIQEGLKRCKSDLHRSFWLYVHHRDVFMLARASEYLDAYPLRAHQYDLGVRRAPLRSEAALEAMRREVREFFGQKFGCGDGSLARLYERSDGVFLLTMYLEDLACKLLEFADGDLRRLSRRPCIHIALEYSTHTGMARSLVRGGGRVHKAVVHAFARHLLEVTHPNHVVRPVTLDLMALCQHPRLPEAPQPGVEAAMRSVTLASPHGNRHVTFALVGESALASSSHEQHADVAVYMKSGWHPVELEVDLRYGIAAPSGAVQRIRLGLSRDGVLNPGRLDAWSRDVAERYLVHAGVLQPGQTLHTAGAPQDQDFADSSLLIA